MKMFRLFVNVACAVLCATVTLFSQTNPTPYDLSLGDYSLLAWSPTNAAGVYPPGIRFHRTANGSAVDPGLAVEFTTDYTLAYNLTGGVRINGLDNDGFGIVNTSSTTNGQLGAAVLALNCANRSNVTVSWLGGTLTQGDGNPTPREYAIRLQYRIGTTAAWTDVPGPIEYTSAGKTNGHTQTFSTVLPIAVNNEPVVQLRWKYYSAAANSGGQRPRLRLDDIVVTSTSAFGTPTALKITSITPSSPSSTSTFAVTVQSVNALGNPVNVPTETSFSLSRFAGTGTLAGTLTGTIPANQNSVIVSGVSYNVAESGVIILASRTAGELLTDGQSAPFTVTQGATQTALIGIQTKGYIGKTFQTFTVEARRQDNSVDPNYTGNVTVTVASGTNSVIGTLTKPLVNGIATFNDIRFSAEGTYTLRFSTTGLSSIDSPPITINPRITMQDVLIPQVVKSTSNLTRVPAYALVRFDNLFPNTTYRFMTSGLENRTLITFGAGNNLHYSAETNSFNYSSNKTLTSTSVPPDYSTFITGPGETSKSVWINILTTGNTRFAEGNSMWWRVFLSDIIGGTPDTLTTVAASRCVEFGSSTTQATGIFDSQSGATPKNIICLYNNEEGTGNPVATALVQDDGTVIFRTFGTNNVVTTKAVDFYEALDQVAGSWVTLIPNNLTGGIKRVEERRLSDGEIVRFYTDADGVWSTVNTVRTSSGITAIDFRTPQLTVTSPTAGQAICALTDQQIRWTSRGVSNVKIDITRNGTGFSPIVASTDGFAQLYDWFITHAENDGATYQVRVTDNEHPMVSGLSQQFSITLPPRLLFQPISQNKCIGDTILLRVGTEGTATAYQWFKDGQPLTGATTNVLRILYARETNTGKYQVRVSGTSICGDIWSDTAIVYVTPELTILKQPQDAVAQLGKTLSLSVEVMGTDKHRYQWFKGNVALQNSTRISGAQTPNLIIREFKATDNGTDYFCRIFAEGNCQIKDTRRINVGPSSITLATQPDTLVAACEGLPFTMRVTTTTVPADLPLRFRWFKGNTELTDGNGITGATTNTIAFANSSAAIAGIYTVKVEALSGNATNQSHNIRVVLGDKPRFIIQPRSREVCAGELFVLNADAISNSLMEYRWIRNGVLLPDRTNSFALQFDTAGRQYFYRCIVTTECGSDTSDLCTITTTALPTITQQPPKTLAIEQSKYGRLTVGAFASRALRYSWVKDGKAIEGNNSPVLEIAIATKKDEGKYWVNVIGDCDTLSSDTTIVTVTAPSSLSEEETQRFVTLSPNPAHSFVTVFVNPLLKPSAMRITDMIGKEIMRFDAQQISESMQIDVQNFMSGQYWITLQSDQGILVLPLHIMK
jgi:hypothetical protein